MIKPNSKDWYVAKWNGTAWINWSREMPLYEARKYSDRLDVVSMVYHKSFFGMLDLFGGPVEIIVS